MLTILLLCICTIYSAQEVLLQKRDVAEEEAAAAGWRKSIRYREVEAGGWPYPFPVTKTDVRCCNNSQCRTALSNGSWCQSGVVCIETFCHTLPNYPCATQVEACDETNRLCIPRRCNSSSQCDDGIFCNGAERCVNTFCLPAIQTHCNGGICNEELRECSFPNLVANWFTFSGNKHPEGSMSLKHFNSTDGTGWPDTWTIWIIVGFGGVVFIVVIIMVIAMVNKNTVVGPVAGGSYFYNSRPAYFG